MMRNSLMLNELRRLASMRMNACLMARISLAYDGQLARFLLLAAKHVSCQVASYGED